VEDKHLATALRGLSGLAIDLKVLPVVNATVKNGTMEGQHGTMIERFVAEWKNRKLGKIAAGEARDLAKAVGLSPTSYGHILHNAVKGGYVTKVGKAGRGGTGYFYALRETK
jgi:hypothetical protein